MLQESNRLASSSDMDSQIGTTLKGYSSHDLTGIANSSLMNRIDSKFLLPVDSLIQVLNACKSYYSLLKIDGVSVFQYDNIYFDTTQLNFYNHHHNRKLNRYKVRHRHYADVGTSYLEVKFKNNKGRTIKNRRIAERDGDIALSSNHDFLKNNGIDCPNSLIATQEVGYQRISLANDAQRERLTLDLNVNFANTLEQSKAENDYTLSNFYIAELKQEKLDRQSPFYQLMRKMSIRPKGFSKYCMSHALTNNQSIKSNRFKANVIKLNNGANQ
jgi:hypothetical protein